MRSFPASLVLCILFLAAHPAVAQDDIANIPPPDPEIERAALKVPEGFEINLFASEPMIEKPI